MQDNELTMLNRENYTPNSDEKDLVHYKVEKPKFDNATGAKISHPELIKTPVKLFESVKRELELQGHVVEIIYHPEGKYNTPIRPADAIDSLSREKSELEAQVEALKAAARDAEERMRAAEMRAQDAEDRAQALEEAASEAIELEETESEEATPKKAGRPAKK